MSAAITEPGVYDIPHADYLADPVKSGSLSCSGAKLLLPPSCPAIFKHRQANPEHADHFDFGHAAHKMALGDGPALAVIDADDWRTKAAREAKAAAYAAGQTPILAADYQHILGMAAALREHPVAGAILAAGDGKPEQTLVWRDRRTGIMRRARLDWLPAAVDGYRLIVADYKTTKRADDVSCDKAMADYRYHLQADWYLDGIRTLGLCSDRDPAFTLVFQEKTPPYLVNVKEPDRTSLIWARLDNDKAIDVYRQCVERDRWPGYSDQITLAQLPGWTVRAYEIAQERGDYDLEHTA